MLPVNVDVERLVLGLLMLDGALLLQVRSVLSPDDFSLEINKRVWHRMTELYDCGRHVDRVTVTTAMRDAGELGSDGFTYLVGLGEGLPLLTDLSAYVRILKDDAARRRIIVVADNLMQRASRREAPQAILDSMENLALEIAPAETGKGLESARQLVERVGISEILSPRVKRGVPFPWAWMNSATCGMLPGELWVLAGHTSTGKSSAAIQAAVSIARTQAKMVSVFTLEMPSVTVFLRAVWQLSRVNSERAKRGQLTPEERKRANDAANLLYGLPLSFDDSSYSAMEIHAQLRRQRSRGPLGLIVIDYLQLLRDGGRHSTRAEAVGANARMLKLMAGEFECPVLLLSQFSRESAKTKPNESPRPPELYDLKESGDIENHANGVWFIHRPSPLDSDQVSVEFMLPKQRDGRRNISHEYWFYPNHQRFEGKGMEE
jgi:replicative DNA helicase